MVGPTKRQPRAFEVVDRASDSGEVAEEGRRSRVGRLEAPEIGRQRALLATSSSARCALLIEASILPRWRDALVGQQAWSTSRSPKRATRGVETAEGRAEVLALGRDGAPAQARLETFRQIFSNRRWSSSGDREAPFAVVVGHVLGRGRAPAAAGLTIGAGESWVMAGLRGGVMTPQVVQRLRAGWRGEARPAPRSR